MKNTKRNNIKIGSFMADQDGVMHGKIYGLGLGATSVMFEPQMSRENKPFYRLIADPAREGYEIGAAFPKDKNGLPYYAVNIDSPVLPAPIHAALFMDRETGGYNLIWSRPDEATGPQQQATRTTAPQPTL